MAVARRKGLTLLFYVNLAVVVLLGAYKAYLILFTEDFVGAHAEQRARIEDRLAGTERYRFAVVGNINNSIGIFERKIVPMLNRGNLDFMVSAGNATSGGGEDKYQSLHGTLERLRLPYLLTFGPREAEGFGSFHFYRHLGPYYYDVTAADTLFLFLDATGKTSFDWQLRWLGERLEASDARHIFLFTGRPLRPVPHEELLVDDDYLLPQPFRDRINELVQRHNVTAVFTANMPLYHHRRVGNTDYVVTGGAGGLVINQDDSFYHYVTVTVDGSRVSLEPTRLEIGQHPVGRTLESLWFFVYSLFYVGFGNFLLILSGLLVLGLWLYRLIFTERDYYPDYDLDPTPWLGRPLRVAMFTNNYLPFVGGVPIAIARLREGLRQLGHRVLLVAPAYRESAGDDADTVRLPARLRMGQRGEFPVANLLSWRLHRRLRDFRPDLIHVHHPFWVGSLGLFLARRRGIPAVYTYHTRLEHYAHYVPLPGALFRNLISHALVRRFANRCQAVVVPTQATEEYLRIIGVRSATFVQPTGIEYEHLATADPEQVTALRRQLGLAGKRVLSLPPESGKEYRVHAGGAEPVAGRERRVSAASDRRRSATGLSAPPDRGPGADATGTVGGRGAPGADAALLPPGGTVRIRQPLRNPGDGDTRGHGGGPARGGGALQRHRRRGATWCQRFQDAPERGAMARRGVPAYGRRGFADAFRRQRPGLRPGAQRGTLRRRHDPDLCPRPGRP